jgi:hypothetical protein
MNIYKLIFANNEVVDCKPLKDPSLVHGPLYEHKNGKLIYAVIQADSEELAKRNANVLLKEVHDRVLGTDYII